MRDKTIAEFLQNLGARQPTPGGGAVAGLNGAIAAAQLKMVYEYSKTDNTREATGKLSKTVDRFLELAENDSKAYVEVRRAYEEGKKDTIEKALLNAVKPSLEVLKYCQELIKSARDNAKSVNKNLRPDMVVALANVKAAVRSSQSMLATNSKSMGPGKEKDSIKDEIVSATQLLNQVDDLYKLIWSLDKNA